MAYDYENDPLFDFGSHTKKSGLKLEGLDPVLSERLKNANEEWLTDPRNKAGSDIPVTSYARDRKTQQGLFERHQKGEKGIYMPINPADYPNQQMFHTNAVDISKDFPEDILEKHGLHKPLGAKDPVHVQANPAFKAPSSANIYDDSNYDFGKYVKDPDQELEDISKPATVNPMLARQGAKMREQGSHLQPFVEDVAKPLEGTTLEDLKNSTPYLAVRANLGGAEGKKEMVERVGAGSEKFVKGIQDFYNAPNKMEIVKQGLQNLYEHPGEAIGEFAKSALLHPEEIVAGNVAGKVAGKVIQKGAGAVKGAVKGISEELANTPEFVQKVAQLKEATGALKEKGKQTMSDLAQGFKEAKQATEPKVPEVASAEMKGAPSVGAAATEHENAVKAALADASPDLQAKFADVPANEIDLDALENHKKFNKFNMYPTEGEALQDVTKMSDEWNHRGKPENEEMMERFKERNPKLIEAFNSLSEKAAPDAHEQNPVKLADTVLNKLKQQYTDLETAEKAAWLKANNAVGEQSAIDVGKLESNVAKALGKANRTKYLPTEIKGDLEDALKKGYLTAEEYENLRTDSALIARTDSKPMARQAAAILREQLENVELKGEFAKYKPLYDEARNATKSLKKLKEEVPAIKAALADTRTIDELDAGNIPHPASTSFIEKYIAGKNVSEVNVKRLIEQLGENSPEHEALKAASIQDLKTKAGIINNEGNVKQAALNKQIHTIYGSKLDTLHGHELANDIRDLADVAKMTEHVKQGPSLANASNTYSAGAREQAKQEVKELGKNIVAGAVEGKINLSTYGVGGTLLRKTYGGWKAGKEAQKLAAEKTAESAKKVELGAGIRKNSLEDIKKGKQ
jgi:rhodanese-related sulfurtransferase